VNAVFRAFKDSSNVILLCDVVKINGAF
jgi:hypothetical protein